MSYKTELHCHSTTVSKCASATPDGIVKAYSDNGYSSLVISNHFSRFTFNNTKNGDRREDSWRDKVDFFMSGYYLLREAAEKYADGESRLDIILGCELRLNTDNNDYLLYGNCEKLLRENQDIMDIDAKELSLRTHAYGLLLVQAHPFRNSMKVTSPDLLDGVEIYNCSPGHDSRNDIAELWADKFGLIKTGGSDFHSTRVHFAVGGIVTEQRITSNELLLEHLKKGNYEILKPKIS